MKEISQEMFIKSVGMNGIDGEKIITMIYSKHININNKELEKLFGDCRGRAAGWHHHPAEHRGNRGREYSPGRRRAAEADQAVCQCLHGRGRP